MIDMQNSNNNKFGLIQKHLKKINQMKYSHMIHQININNQKNKNLFTNALNNITDNVNDKLNYNQTSFDKNLKKLEIQINNLKKSNEMCIKKMSKQYSMIIKIQNYLHLLLYNVLKMRLEVKCKLFGNGNNLLNFVEPVSTNDINICDELKQLQNTINKDSIVLFSKLEKLNEYITGSIDINSISFEHKQCNDVDIKKLLLKHIRIV